MFHFGLPEFRRAGGAIAIKNSGTALEEQSQNDPAEPPETLRAMGLKKGSDRPLPQCNDPAPTFESKDK